MSQSVAKSTARADVFGPVSLVEIEAMRARNGDRAWAHLLQLREQRGQKLNGNQVRCYRNALNLNVPAK